MNDLALPFESYGVSHRGCVRQDNEDGFLVEPGSGLWLVADGMGGHEGGEFASATIVRHLGTIGVATSAPDLRARFEDRLGRAHAQIRDISRERGVTIGSTIAALLAIDGRFACLWSGDSRIYLVRNGAISQISRDHTEVQELLDRGIISPDEALTWPRKNVITRAVGVAPDLIIDIAQGDVRSGDQFILASDGLTRLVDDGELEAALTAMPPADAAENLIETVLSRGAPDNITMVIVNVT